MKNCGISIHISPRFVPKIPVDNMSALVDTMEAIRPTWTSDVIVLQWILLWRYCDMTHDRRVKKCNMIEKIIVSSMMTSSMESFSALLALFARNSPVTNEFPSQRPVTRSFDVFFELRLNKRLSKQSRRLWFETPSRSWWRHCVVIEAHLCSSCLPRCKWNPVCTYPCHTSLHRCCHILNSSGHKLEKWKS